MHLHTVLGSQHGGDEPVSRGLTTIQHIVTAVTLDRCSLYCMPRSAIMRAKKSLLQPGYYSIT